MMDSVIQLEGTIYEDGYGLLAQKVMRDKTLPKQSKLIYAYMCSFASVGKNGERTAFPSVSLQCSELGMSEDTYYKWRKFLVDRGYIKIKRQRQDGAKFDNNIYSIVAVPVEVEIKETDENVDTKGKEPHPKNKGTDKKPYPKKPSTEKPSTEKSGTNSTSLNSTSFNKEEEEELITLENVNSFLTEQIEKREITNPKTLLAIFEVAPKCRAINTTDKEAMENYCIKVVEEKMSKLGQKQAKSKQAKSNKKEPIRTEMLPEWFVENPEESKQVEKKDPEQAELNRQEIDEMLKKLRS